MPSKAASASMLSWSRRQVKDAPPILVMKRLATRMLARIKEVEVDLNMKDIPIAWFSRTTARSTDAAPVNTSRRQDCQRQSTPAAHSHIGAD
jgi:hypothetical protein